MAISFTSPRQESQVVRSGQQVADDFKTTESNYQSEMAALMRAMQTIQSPEQNAYSAAASHAGSGALDSFFQDQSKYDSSWATPEKQNWYKDEYATYVAPTLMSGGNTAQDQAYIDQFGGLKSVAGYDPGQVASQYSGDMQSLSDKFAKQKAEFDAFQANEKRQQQGYTQQTGGGFSGGIIDASYSDPFSNQISGQSVGGLGGLGGMPTDPSMPNVAMPWQQPWGTPGFGQPGQGNSQGVGGYSPSGQQSTNQPGSQWGGVFGAKNPWSPA